MEPCNLVFPFCRQAKVAFEYETAETSAEMNKEEFNAELKTLTYVCC